MKLHGARAAQSFPYSPLFRPGCNRAPLRNLLPFRPYNRGEAAATCGSLGRPPQLSLSNEWLGDLTNAAGQSCYLGPESDWPAVRSVSVSQTGAAFEPPSRETGPSKSKCSSAPRASLVGPCRICALMLCSGRLVTASRGPPCLLQA